MSNPEAPLSELTLRAFSDYSSDGFYLHDATGRIVEVNSRACEMMGYKREELIGMHPADFDRTASMPMVESMMEKLHRMEELAFEGLHQRSDGTTYPVKVRLRPFRTEEGLFAVAAVRDITKEKESQLSFERQAQMLQGAQKLTGLGCFDWNIETNEVTWSDTLFEIYGRCPRTFEVTLESFMAHLHPGDQERVAKVIQHAVETCTDFQTEERIIRPGGEIRHLESRGTVIADAHGRPKRVVGACLDITKRIAAEEKVRESQKMEALGRLAGGVAHDFNNLLTVINGCSELALDNTHGTDENYDLLREVIDASKRAGELTSQLLAFSRGKNGEPQVVNLQKIIFGSMMFLQRLAGDKIMLLPRLGEEPIYIATDPSQFEQILINLVTNAREAMPDGGQIVISLCPKGDFVELSVKDGGRGIPEEQRARIFDPFFTTKPAGTGTGLGLSIVYGIVSRSGGSIEVKSKEGEGSEFVLAFPSAKAPAARDGDAHRPPHGEPVVPKTILLAEDNDAVRGVCVRVLRREGYRVLEASNGAEALRCLKESEVSIDLLLTDLIMPEMDGAQLAREAAVLFPELTIAYMSGYFEESTLLKGFTQDPKTFLQKPFSPAALLEKLHDLLQDSAGLTASV